MTSFLGVQNEPPRVSHTTKLGSNLLSDGDINSHHNRPYFYFLKLIRTHFLSTLTSQGVILQHLLIFFHISNKGSIYFNSYPQVLDQMGISLTIQHINKRRSLLHSEETPEGVTIHIEGIKIHNLPYDKL